MTDQQGAPPMTAARMAQISARAYQHMSPWSESAFDARLARSDTVLARTGNAFVLGQVVLDEAEILALATDPAAQRQGEAAHALALFETAVRARGVTRVLLEVAAPNAPARAFYEKHGFAQCGLRRAYYAQPQGGRADALLMARALV